MATENRSGRPQRHSDPWSLWSQSPSPLDPSTLASDWVRLAPWSNNSLMELGSSEISFDADDKPVDATFVIDRKLVPTIDLFGSTANPIALVSDRFAKIIAALKIKDVALREVPHATPNAVAGRRLYALHLPHELPQLLSRIERMGDAPLPGRGWAGGLPYSPATFRGIEPRTPAVVWTPWFGFDPFEFRNLVVHGFVLRSLAEDGVHLECAGEPVSIASEPHAAMDRLRKGWVANALGSTAAPSYTFDPGQFTTVCARIGSEAQQYLHALGKTPNTELARLLKTNKQPAELVGAINKIGIKSLFGRGVQFVAGGETIDEATSETASITNAVPTGALVFARSRNGEIAWALRADGRVCGIGQDGVVYGPDVPFWKWFVDQHADLSFAWEHQNEQWANQMISG